MAYFYTYLTESEHRTACTYPTREVLAETGDRVLI